ncbi:MAG TPA: ABC transporter substrate-binding protein [Longimicrobiaceae bacterium]|nr:ABC transporter substrate-binding protein [Longimicrobiaceae bacterium]
MRSVATPARHPTWASRSRGLAALALAGLVGLAGCGDGERQTAPTGGQVVIGHGADMDKPNSLIISTDLDSYVVDMLYPRVLGVLWEDGELEYVTMDRDPSALARSYEYFGPDSASIRYHLRSDMRWSDGQPVTAHDAAFTLQTQGLPEVASPRQDYNREIREIVAENDSSLVVHFTRRYPEIHFHTAGAIVPRHVYEGSDLSQMRSHPTMTDPVANLVTAGPMRLTQWLRGQRIVLERSPDFEPQPQIDRIVFRIIPEETTRMIELQTGNIDVAQVPFNFVPEIRAANHLRIDTEEKRSYEYIAYNPRGHTFFADPEIRRALGLALDKDAMIAALQMEEFAAPAGGPYPEIFRRLYDPEDQASLPYDTARASQILAGKGWTRGRDGVLTRNGQRFSFTLATNGENRRRVDIAQLAEQHWSRIGVNANIQTMEFNTLMDRTQNRQFEATILGWNVGLSPDLYQLWGDPELPFNFVSYDNPQAQALMEQAVAQPTEEAAAPIWREIASLISADQPYTWLFFYDRPYGVNNRVQGMRIDTLSPYQRVWEWRIEQ